MAYDIQHARQDDNFTSIPRRDVLVYDQKDVPCIACREVCHRMYYLVESAGELLVVARHNSRRFHAHHAVDHKVAFSVHRVDEEKGQLERVYELGDRMLFVEVGCSQSWSRPELTSDFFSENCIYMVVYVGGSDIARSYRLGKFPIGGDLETSFSEFHEDGFHNMPIWVTPIYPN